MTKDQIPQELKDAGITRVVEDRPFAHYRLQMFNNHCMALLGADSATGHGAVMVNCWDLHKDKAKIEQFWRANEAVREKLI